jgi:Holliday junction resolvasome RuvABC DNA-binding subunit
MVGPPGAVAVLSSNSVAALCTALRAANQETRS